MMYQHNKNEVIYNVIKPLGEYDTANQTLTFDLFSLF